MDFEKQFNDWFNEIEAFALRSERFYDYLEHKDADMLYKFLRAAYEQGAKDMAVDTVNILRDYGTACAGLDSPNYNETEAYDSSAESLDAYYEDIFKDNWMR